MDSTLFDYGDGNIMQHGANGLDILILLNQIKKAHVSISWHQRVCSSDYGWNLMYQNVLGHEALIGRKAMDGI